MSWEQKAHIWIKRKGFLEIIKKIKESKIQARNSNRRLFKCICSKKNNLKRKLKIWMLKFKRNLLSLFRKISIKMANLILYIQNLLKRKKIWFISSLVILFIKWIIILGIICRRNWSVIRKIYMKKLMVLSILEKESVKIWLNFYKNVQKDQLRFKTNN